MTASLRTPPALTYFNAGWNNSGETDPSVYYFDDKGICKYSVPFTATDEVAWGGIDGTRKCYIQGLCNPQYVFYRDGYNIILNTCRKSRISGLSVKKKTPS